MRKQTLREQFWRKQTCVALLSVLAASSLGGCSYYPSETRAAFEPVTDSTAAGRPLATLPSEGGNVVAVLDSRLAGVYTQRIVLSGDASTPGENAIVVQIDQSQRHIADLSSIPKPTQDGVARELESNFPTVDMQISRAWGHNDFGPFGYAVGAASGGVTCLYAWQFAQGATIKLVGDTQAIAAAESMPAAPTSIRVRLCRKGLSETELVSLVQALEVYPPAGGTAYHDTLYAGVGSQGSADALQAAGAPGDFYAHHASAAPERRVSHAVHRQTAGRRAPRRQAMAPVAPRAGEVMVPLPSGTAGSSAPAGLVPSATNPLLAPLAAAPQSRPVASANEEMPLPGVAGQSPAGSTRAAPEPAHSSAAMPLPN